ncbi:MAG: IclR family transcriptional regulator [Actinobacteria bacterium]|nr:MAG: IclR family transcriptional regulator [Actinomycetota bacterium]
MVESTSQTIATVERATDVLLLFAKPNHPHLGVTDIADELSLSKAAVHRILASLRSRGFIELIEESRRYQLGASSLSLGIAYLARIDMRQIAVPELQQLSLASKETATLSIRTGNERIYVDQVLPAREIVMTVSIGVPYPLHAGSSSKAFLAFLKPDDQERYLATKMGQVTEKTITNSEQLRGELAEIKQRGFASSFGERQAGAASIASPIFDHTGAPAAVISLCGPADRFKNEIDDCVPLILAATARISRRLGFNPNS